MNGDDGERAPLADILLTLDELTVRIAMGEAALFDSQGTPHTGQAAYAWERLLFMLNRMEDGRYALIVALNAYAALN